MTKSAFRWSALVASSFIFSGCVTAESILLASQEGCSRYGFSPGTQQYASCVQQENARLTNQQIEKRSALNAQMIETNRANMQALENMNKSMESDLFRKNRDAQRDRKN